MTETKQRQGEALIDIRYSVFSKIYVSIEGIGAVSEDSFSLERHETLTTQYSYPSKSPTSVSAKSSSSEFTVAFLAGGPLGAALGALGAFKGEFGVYVVESAISCNISRNKYTHYTGHIIRSWVKGETFVITWELSSFIDFSVSVELWPGRSERSGRAGLSER